MNRIFIFMFLSIQSFCQKNDVGLHYILNEEDIRGGMLFYDLNEDEYITNYFTTIEGRKKPGTYFHLFNTIMFYHLGIVKDSTQALDWDKQERNFNDYKIPEWNKDTYLGEAFRNGTDWYFKDLSKVIELKLYKKLIKESGYGRMVSTRKKRLYVESSG